MQALSVSVPENKTAKVAVLISCVSKKPNTDNGSVAAKGSYHSLLLRAPDSPNQVLNISEEDCSDVTANLDSLPQIFKD